MAQSDLIHLIDPNTLFREGLKRLVEAGGFGVVAESGTLTEALAHASFPRLVIVDPLPAGPEVLSRFRELRHRAPDSRLLILTASLEPRRLSDLLQAGADGYLLKDMSSEALVQSLRLLALGEMVFPADVARMLIAPAATLPAAGPAIRKSLSQREAQILRCLVHGDSNKVIGLRLDITEATVKVHLKSLLRKIGAANRTQAAIWAMNNGMADAPRPKNLQAVG
jgi:two-component system nitrate/nitrite response regulator NarL